MIKLLFIVLVSGIFAEYNVSYNRPKLCPNATWNPNGETLNNRNDSNPHVVFVDRMDRIYVTNFGTTERVFTWPNISTKFSTSFFAPGPSSYGLFVTIDGTIYVDESTTNHILIFYPNQTTDTIIKPYTNSCYGLFIDHDDTIYCSMPSKNLVFKKSLRNNENISWDVAAGQNGSSVGSSSLNHPQGIFVDVDGTLYVADTDNDTIQVFNSTSSSGSPPRHIRPINLSNKSHPTGITLDHDGNLFIVNNQENKIVRVLKNATTSGCIIRCLGTGGSKPDQIQNPVSLAFDTMGNLYVADTGNRRVQKFYLNTNSCGTSEPSTTSVDSTPENVVSTSTNDQSSSSTRTTTITERSSTHSESTTTHVDADSSTDITRSTFRSSIATGTKKTVPDDYYSTVEPTTMTTQTSPSKESYVASQCSNDSYIGTNCGVLTHPCDALKPCQHSGKCVPNPNVPPKYTCACEENYQGWNCEIDRRSCEHNTCLYNGICINLPDESFHCNCTDNKLGIHCEISRNYCYNVTCHNRAVCQSKPGGYECVCLSGSYSGSLCEEVDNDIIVRQIVSKTFAYIAITALALLATFVITMDVLKYICGIDPVAADEPLFRRGRALLKRRESKQRRPARIRIPQRVNKIEPIYLVDE